MESLRRTVLVVALLNLTYFFIEFVMAVHLESVSLFADSVDFFEDAAINFLVFFAVLWSARARRIAGSVLAGIILLPAVAAVVTAVVKIVHPSTPEPIALTATAVGAFAVNLVAAMLLVRFRSTAETSSDGAHGPSGTALARGAWLAARNDVLANLLIIAAGLATLFVRTAWFDIVVGLIIAALNFSAAKEVWEASRFAGDPTELLDED